MEDRRRNCKRLVIKRSGATDRQQGTKDKATHRNIRLCKSPGRRLAGQMEQIEETLVDPTIAEKVAA